LTASRRARRGGLLALLATAALVTAPPASAEQAFPGLERDVFLRINEHRLASGLEPLGYDEQIARVAREHSRAMAAGQARFGHQGFESRTRALRARLELRGAAENVSRHTRRRSQVPRAAVENWLKSRGHRRNIEGRYGTTGVGAARDPDGTWYLTQIFVAP
jgi:uncharacterized protein YkwD